jgi:hypothetical protein
MEQRLTLLVAVAALLTIFLLGAAPTQVDLTADVKNGLPTANGGVPSGMIEFVNTGSCPTGYTQLSLAGDYILLTVAANGDVGTTGGSLTSGATSAGTPAGTNGTASVAFVGTKFTTSSSGSYAFTSLGGTAAAASGSHSVPAETFTGSAMATHTHTIQPTYVKLIACQKN